MPPLRRYALLPDPLGQFESWFQDAVVAEVREPHAMCLATASRDARPNARMVLLRGYDARGFEFYSNYSSQKGLELADNPLGAILFYWQAAGRQIRISGRIERIERSESAIYFAQRPRGSQLGAWASDQSTVIESRQYLDRRFQEFARQFENETVPLPPDWGGFRLVPAEYEFWQRGEDRLHDRFRYLRETGGAWRIERLSP